MNVATLILFRSRVNATSHLWAEPCRFDLIVPTISVLRIVIILGDTRHRASTSSSSALPCSCELLQRDSFGVSFTTI